MIGARFRAARLASGSSLTDVASKAKISAATLSRIETGKQSLDAEMIVTLARIIGIEPAELFGHSDDGNSELLARRIAAMSGHDRAALWRSLTAESRPRRSVRNSSDHFAQQIDELLAQFDFIRGELEILRRNISARRR